ncbi:hypothetical protein IG631_05930 [Alternaria alternata]|nr:hypothetical protein IG631_05930 [Alternaria alternata]
MTSEGTSSGHYGRLAALPRVLLPNHMLGPSAKTFRSPVPPRVDGRTGAGSFDGRHYSSQTPCFKIIQKAILALITTSITGIGCSACPARNDARPVETLKKIEPDVSRRAMSTKTCKLYRCGNFWGNGTNS